jgi:hypothetical protein
MDKNLQAVNLIGLFILLTSMLAGDKLFGVEINAMLTGFATGWIISVWFLRYLTLKDQAKEGKKKSEELAQKLVDEYKIHK